MAIVHKLVLPTITRYCPVCKHTTKHQFFMAMFKCLRCKKVT